VASPEKSPDIGNNCSCTESIDVFASVRGPHSYGDAYGCFTGVYEQTGPEMERQGFTDTDRVSDYYKDY
jgi:hypothetical protein